MKKFEQFTGKQEKIIDNQRDSGGKEDIGKGKEKLSDVIQHNKQFQDERSQDQQTPWGWDKNPFSEDIEVTPRSSLEIAEPAKDTSDGEKGKGHAESSQTQNQEAWRDFLRNAGQLDAPSEQIENHDQPVTISERDKYFMKRQDEIQTHYGKRARDLRTRHEAELRNPDLPDVFKEVYKKALDSVLDEIHDRRRQAMKELSRKMEQERDAATSDQKNIDVGRIDHHV